MLDRVGIRRYLKSDRPRVLEFLPTVYPLARANRLIAQWDWKYDACPFNPEPDPYLLLLQDGDRVVGMLGALSLRVSVRGSELSISSACDAVVHPGYRGLHLFSPMYRRYVQDRPVGMGWGNPASNHIWSSAAAESERVIPLYALSLFGARPISGRGDSARADEIKVIPTEQFDERFDRLWQSVRPDYPVAVVRDRAYLSWRFDQRPDANYARLCAMRGDDLVGYLVVRVAPKGGLRIGFLVDWLVRAGDRATFALLVRNAFALLRRERVVLVCTRTSNPAFRQCLHRTGFVPWFWGPREYAIARVSLPDENLQIIRDQGQWFSTMGDGDLEMGY